MGYRIPVVSKGGRKAGFAAVDCLSHDSAWPEKRRLWGVLIALCFALGMAIGPCMTATASEGTPAENTLANVTFKANDKTKTVTVTLPHEFQGDCEDGNGELDLIIKELYGFNEGACDIEYDESAPVAAGNSCVKAGLIIDEDGYPTGHYIAVDDVFSGTATVAGGYWAFADELSDEPFRYSLEISATDAEKEKKAAIAKAEEAAAAAAADPTLDNINTANDAIAAAKDAKATDEELAKATASMEEAKEAAITAAAKAAAAAAANPTDAYIKAAESAIAAAEAAGATDDQLKDAKAKLDAAKKANADASATKKAFIDAAGKVPNSAKVQESDRAAVNAATAAYNKLSADQKKDAAVTAAKAKIDGAQKALDNPVIAFGNAKVTKKLNAAKTATKTIKLKKGSKLKLKAKSSTGAKVTYKTSKKKVAKVSSKGVIKAVKKGKATITVKCNNTTVKVKIKVESK